MSKIAEYEGADVLADVLDSLKLRGRFFCQTDLSAPWSLSFAAGFFAHFHLVERGTCWLQIDGVPDTLTNKEGDLVVVIPRGQGYQLSDRPGTPPVPLTELIGDSRGGLRAVIKHGGGGPQTELICGAFEYQGPQANAALAVLPLWIRIPKRERHANEWLNSTLGFLRREAKQASLGSETIVARLIDVIFVEAVRTWLKDQPRGSAGWLGALRDPAIGAALGLLHKNPERAWTVPSLAARVGMSRSPFAARFAALVGQSPMSYLKHWRLELAVRLLREQNLSLATIAEQVGYESAAAFSRVFKREFRVSPGQYRRKTMVGRQTSIVGSPG